jgi:hypothetical protein
MTITGFIVSDFLHPVARRADCDETNAEDRSRLYALRFPFGGVSTHTRSRSGEKMIHPLSPSFRRAGPDVWCLNQVRCRRSERLSDHLG